MTCKLLVAVATLFLACGNEEVEPGSSPRAGGAGMEAPADREPASACARGILDGDYAIWERRHVDPIADCVAISGTLEIDLDGPAVIMLERLESVGGDLIVSPGDQPRSLLLPALTSVGGDLTIDRNFRALDLSRLVEVGGMLQLSGTSLVELLLPKLESVGGLWLSSNLLMEVVELPLLTTIRDDFIMTDAFGLMEANLPLLTSVGGDLSVTHTGLYQWTLQLPSLKAVSGELHINDLRYTVHQIGLESLETVGSDLELRHTRIEELKLPALTTIGAGFILYDNVALHTIEAPKLASLNSLTFESNDSLKSCVGQMLIAELQSNGFMGMVEASYSNFDACE